MIAQSVKRRFYGHAARINSVACSSSSEAIFSGSYDATVRIWDGRSWSHEPVQILNDAKDSVTCVKIVQNSTTSEIITSSVDGNLRTYDLRMGQLRCDSIGEPITSFTLTHDKKCIVPNCLNGGIYLFEKDSMQCLMAYKDHHRAGRYSLECSVLAHDEFILTGSEDGEAVIYNLVDGTLVQKCQGHKQPTCSVASHPNKSSIFVSASYDGNAIVWANPSQLLKT